MESEITQGEPICKIIKQIYFPDVPWSECYRKVGNKFTVLKEVVRRFYGLEKKQNPELLDKIKRFDALDVQEAFDMESELVKEVKEVKDLKYGTAVTWIPVPVNKPELEAQIKSLLAA